MPGRVRSPRFAGAIAALTMAGLSLAAAPDAHAQAGGPAAAATTIAAVAPDAAASTKVNAPAKAAPDAEVRSLFDRGVAAHDQGKLVVALDLFQRAWALKKTWDVAANLGIVEHKLHRDALAAEHLSLSLRALPPSESDQTRKGIEHELAPVLAAVAKITVRAAVTGAEVRVDGQVKGITPLDGPVFAAPGVVAVELRKDGYETVSQSLAATAGGALDATFVLRPRTPPAERSWAAPAVAFGFGGAGLITGAVAGAFAAVRFAELQKSCGRGLVCPEDLRASADEGRAAAHIATTGFLFAGAGLALGVTLLAIPIRSAPARVGLSLGPGFVSLKGAF